MSKKYGNLGILIQKKYCENCNSFFPVTDPTATHEDCKAKKEGKKIVAPKGAVSNGVLYF